MTIHALATSSLETGALSSATATLDVTTDWQDSQRELGWIERVGPEVEAPPEPSGFGSKLVGRSISKRLGGTNDYDWQREGLVVIPRLDRRKLAARAEA